MSVDRKQRCLCCGWIVRRCARPGTGMDERRKGISAAGDPSRNRDVAPPLSQCGAPLGARPQRDVSCGTVIREARKLLQRRDFVEEVFPLPRRSDERLLRRRGAWGQGAKAFSECTTNDTDACCMLRISSAMYTALKRSRVLHELRKEGRGSTHVGCGNGDNVLQVIFLQAILFLVPGRLLFCRLDGFSSQTRCKTNIRSNIRQ